MGAYEFENRVKGKTAKDAFLAARERAQWEHGHGGYSGTIAEKGDFVQFTFPKGMPEEEILAMVMDLHEDGTYGGEVDWDFKAMKTIITKPGEPVPAALLPTVERAHQVAHDKWGPAACVEVAEPDAEGNRTFLFFGCASS